MTRPEPPAFWTADELTRLVYWQDRFRHGSASEFDVVEEPRVWACPIGHGGPPTVPLRAVMPW